MKDVLLLFFLLLFCFSALDTAQSQISFFSGELKPLLRANCEEKEKKKKSDVVFKKKM